jgi:RecB family exonuclease
MLEGDTIVIHDWKTHFDPPSLRQLERDDVQLGLYALGLTRGRPDLVSGRRIKLVWDFKEFSQEIVVDAAYLQKVERRALTLLRGIETLSERVEARRGEWLRRLDPKPDASALEAARSDADRLGEVSAALDEKQAALRGLRRRRASAEEALVRYARERGLSEVSGTRRTLSIITSKSRAIPTKAEDPEANDEAAAILKREGLYEKYSTLSPSELKRAAEFQGGEDYPVFQKLKPFLISGFTSSIEVEPARGPSGSKGVAKPKLPRESAFPEEAEPGLLSATQIAVFLDDKDEFVRRYLLRERSLGPKPMGFLAGSAIHKALEQLFKWVKGGREGKGILLKDLMGAFDQAWAESRSERPFEPDPGLTEADYIRGSKAYLKAMFQKAYPFDQGRPVYLERRMHFTLTDPRTGKIYRFQGIPDRVMIEGDAVAVRDWKSNFRPPSDEEVKAKDYQLGLYLLALRELFPDLMRGRKGRLVWDFKDKETVIEADDAYLADLSERLFSVLREMDKLKEDFRLHRSAWEERLRPAGAPEDEASAARKVDELSEIDARLEAAEEEAKALKGEAADLEARLAAFLRESGLARVQGSSHAARLIEKGGFYVPTKTREPKAYAKVVEILKAAGAWERYSMLDTAALKKAMADPRHPDQGAFSALKGLLRESTAVKTELSED